MFSHYTEKPWQILPVGEPGREALRTVVLTVLSLKDSGAAFCADGLPTAIRITIDCRACVGRRTNAVPSLNLVEDVRKRPRKVSDIDRRLTA